jgi:hypothetical protein
MPKKTREGVKVRKRECALERDGVCKREGEKDSEIVCVCVRMCV